MRIPHNQSHAGGNVLLNRIAVLASPHTDAMALGKLGSHGSHLPWMRRPGPCAQGHAPPSILAAPTRAL